jgi:tetratricopeptide (TPR) repeat protein
MHICFALEHLGEIARVESNYAIAKKYYLEGLAIGRELGSKLLIAEPAVSLGFCAIHDGELDSARSYFVEILEMAQTLEFKSLVASALVGLGRIALAEKRARHAVPILGAVERLHEEREIGILVNDSDYNQCLDLAHEQLDQVAFNAAWEEGRAMSLDQAIEYALKDS